ncbi:hypothetical protein [Cryptosporangium aurantiacum]|uniref:Uncharacterized protein n=1 Tax=Cryptosporangium aurantiacum TaxID=134849 RepID=A0A1M7PQS4_9ACTN|nr:hypothetical protein [Cryptosporangium aurantiacum]SHN19699.1 hypothetical protein SAMN05443668_103591 [Cryptosporangium aurantiacum]
MQPEDPAWNVRGDQPIATWVIEFPADTDRATLLNWQHTVIAAGEDTLAYRIHDEHSTGYQRARHGSFADYLHHLGDQVPAPPGEYRTGLIFDEAPQAISRLAHPAPDSTITETDIWTMRQIASHAPSSQWPLTIASDRNQPHGSIGVAIWISTKIWLPWIYRYTVDGNTDPEFDAHNPPLDNRELATRHTPRLNTFLHAAATATRAAGGTWTLGHDTSATYLFELHTAGVRLDASRPPWPHLVPPPDRSDRKTRQRRNPGPPAPNRPPSQPYR